MMTIDVVTSAALWCDNRGAFLVPLAVDGHSRLGVRLEVRGVRVVLRLHHGDGRGAGGGAGSADENSLKIGASNPLTIV